MINVDDSAALRRHRRQIQQLSARRKRISVLKWLASLLVVGLGACGPLYMVRLFQPNAVPLKAEIAVLALTGAFAGGIFGFLCYYLFTFSSNSKLRLIDGDWHEPAAPGKIAYVFAIPVAILSAGFLAVKADWSSLAFPVALAGASLAFAGWSRLASPLVLPRITVDQLAAEE
jgi:hypothetical protein